MVIPLERSLRHAKMFQKTEPVTLHNLLSEDIRRIDRKGRIDLMLQRVVANGKQNSNNYQIRTYNARGAKRNESTTNYSRLFLFSVFSGNERGSLVYMMEAKNTNEKLWKRNVCHRDDGTISIGTIIRVMHPLPIEKILPDGIPCLTTRFPAIVMKPPPIFPEAHIDMSVTGGRSMAFALTNCEVEVLSTVPEETGCSGHFCDKQRIHEIVQYGQGCGCYSFVNRRSNIVLDHSIKISHPSLDDAIVVENFSSTRFSNLYLSGPFSTTTRAETLLLSDTFYDIEEAVDRAIKYINDNGGFTVIGWYKRGQINDRSMFVSGTSSTNQNTQPQEQIDNGKVIPHPCFVQPTSLDLLNLDALKNTQFDTSQAPVNNSE